MDDTRLRKLRARIDELDDGIAALLARRAEAAAAIGEIKTAENAAAYSAPAREAQILRRVGKLGGKLGKDAMGAIYREVIAACLACERPQTVAYLGPPGTFSHEAARRFYGVPAALSPCASIAEAVRAAEKENCDFAMVPLENSNGGVIGETVDELLTTPLSVCGEFMLRVRNHLLGRGKTKNIREIYGHPQPLQQCRRWLAANFPKAQIIAVASTAVAAQKAAEQKNAAAVGSAMAAEIYKLQTLAADIEDSAFNTTRFLSLGAQKELPQTGEDKTSLIMSMREEAGAMCSVLTPLAKHGVNMSKLESRPARGQIWKYIFFADLDGHATDKPVAAALAELQKRAAFVKILGSYPKAAP